MLLFRIFFFFFKLAPNTYISELSLVYTKYLFEKFHSISLYIPDYITIIPIYCKQVNYHTSWHIPTSRIYSLIVRRLRSVTGNQLSTPVILFNQHIRKDRGKYKLYPPFGKFMFPGFVFF